MADVEAMETGSRGRRILWLLPPLAVGVLLRLFGIVRQVVSGDELHAVRAATSIDFPSILYTYQLTDHCIPLSSFYRLVMLLGGSLNETILRLPVMVSGLLVLVLIPLWIDRRLGRRTAQTVAWWLALSPLMIYYARIVRSYTPIVLLGFVTMAFFVAWVEDRRLRFAAGYVVSGALTIYFHPVAGPFVVAPIGWLIAARILVGRKVPSLRSAVALSVAMAAALAAFLIPAFGSLTSLVEKKHVTSELTAWTWKGVAILQAGTPNTPLVVAFWVLVAVGLVALLMKDRLLGTLGPVFVVTQIAGLVVLSPLAMEQPNILNRYLLVCVPLVLMWAAAGLEVAVFGPIARLGRPGTIAATALTCCVPVVFFVSGPTLDPLNVHGSFAHRASYTAFFKPPKKRPELVMPEAYEWLSTQREGAIVEYPWSPFWRYMPVIIEYQQLHGREVVVGIGDRTLWQPELRFRNMVQPWPDRILESRASWLILHFDLVGEAERFDVAGKRNESRAARDRERRLRILGKMQRRASTLERELRSLWGKPDYRDDEHVVWDLGGVRAGRAGSIVPDVVGTGPETSDPGQGQGKELEE